jgi:hypothetical protein
MSVHLEIVAALGTFVLLLAVLELVRRRRLLERYALVWLLSAVLLMVLAVWQAPLQRIADLLGVRYPSNALFVVAFAFVLLLLLHFSAVISQLADQSKVLAQRLALLEERLHRQEDLGQDKFNQENEHAAHASEAMKH